MENNLPTNTSINLFESYRKISQNKYFDLPERNIALKKHYTNGNYDKVSKLRVEVGDDLKECKKLWDIFKKEESVFDLWKFRYPFHKYYLCKPYFLTIYIDSDPVGLLPLSYGPTVNGYRWFGTSWPEDNKFFVKDPIFVPLLMYLAPYPVALYAIEADEKNKLPDFTPLEIDDSKYILDLTRHLSFADYLNTLKKKKRYNFKRDIKKFKSLQTITEINNSSRFDEMIVIGKERFKIKGDISEWEENPQSIEMSRELMLDNPDYITRTVSAIIGNELAGSDMISIYKGKYYCLGGAYNTKSFSGIGNYMNYLEIEDALNMGCKVIDFLQIDYGWKHKWFTEVPLYKYERL